MSKSPIWVLVLAAIGISVAGPLVRLSTSHPITIAMWRLLFSLPLIAVPLFASGEWRDWRRLRPSDFGLAIVSGVMLALHFWAWNTSLHLTTIAASTTLVNTQPVIVAILSAAFLREPPTKQQTVGIGIAIIGAAIIALSSAGGITDAAPRPGLGNLLACSAAVTAAIYYVIGRRLRSTLGVWGYTGLVYTVCFLALAGLALFIGAPLSTPLTSSKELAIVAGLAIGPMLLGHTGLNWALRYLPAPVVNAFVLAEPVGATLIAALLPGIGEIPSVPTVLGGVVVLSGIAAAMWPVLKVRS